MTKYRAVVTFPDGDEMTLEELFDNEDDASQAALNAISDWDTGAEVLNMSNPGDYYYDENDIDNADYYIEEIDE